MKKYPILFFVTALLSLNSCSKDDDTAVNDDPIIGSWTVVQTTPVMLGNEILCEEDSFISFREDNTATSTFYLEENNCEPETTNGTWENKQDGNYEIGIPFLGTQVAKIEFNGSDEFTYISPQGIRIVFQRIP